MSTKLLLTLGPGLVPAKEANILVLDWSRGEVIDSFKYCHTIYPESHKGFAGCSRSGSQLLVAMEAELLKLDLNPLKLVDSRSFSFLNDVHHIAAVDGSVFVCNTGLDCIEELDSDWNHVRTHHLVRRFGCEFKHLITLARRDFTKSWNRLIGRYPYYSHMPKRPSFRNLVKLVRENAYRRNGCELQFSDFRPHFLHPNHLLACRNDLWATLYMTGKVVSLKSGKTIAQGLGRPHDGVICGDAYYVTDCASNRLISFNTEGEDGDLQVGEKATEVFLTRNKYEGFLRGVCASNDFIFVGMTARRGASKSQQVARLIAIDHQTMQPVSEWAVPTEFGLSIFSIQDVSDVY